MRSTNDIIDFCRQSSSSDTSVLWLGYSGGVDSSLLLHVLAHSELKHRVKAIHINHALSPYAGDWQAHCESTCRAYGIELIVKHVDVRARAESLELAARTLRYQEFAELMAAGDTLLNAHHANDQAETMLYRLVRGAGLSGLGGIKKSRPFANGCLVRPFLDWSKEELIQCAQQLGLKWVEDESNDHDIYDRNFLRSKVLPLLETRWPKAAMKIAQTSRWLSEAEQLLETYAREDLARCSPQSCKGGETISIQALQKFPLLRQKNIIRCWCKTHFDLVPQAAQLDGLTELCNARIDACPQLRWGDFYIRRFKQRLYLLHVDSGDAVLQAPIAWNSACDLRLADRSYLRCEIGENSTAPKKEPTALKKEPSREPFIFTVSFRQGGERCKPLKRRHSQTLKKLLQEYALEPWLRDRVPLIYYQQELVAVGDLFLCESEFVRSYPAVSFSWLEDKR